MVCHTFPHRSPGGKCFYSSEISYFVLKNSKSKFFNFLSEIYNTRFDWFDLKFVKHARWIFVNLHTWCKCCWPDFEKRAKSSLRWFYVQAIPNELSHQNVTSVLFSFLMSNFPVLFTARVKRLCWLICLPWQCYMWHFLWHSGLVAPEVPLEGDGICRGSPFQWSWVHSTPDKNSFPQIFWKLKSYKCAEIQLRPRGVGCHTCNISTSDVRLLD